MRYKIIRIPVEAHEKLKEKKGRMESIFKQITGQQKRLPMTKLITTISSSPIQLGDSELVSLFRNKRRIRVI
jgi:hypothetical protein